MKRFLWFGIIAVGLACAGVGDPTRSAEVQVSFATRAVPAPLLSASRTGMLSDTVVIGTDTLILTSVEVVLKEIEMKRVETPDCVAADDECEKFELGPVQVRVRSPLPRFKPAGSVSPANSRA